MPQSSQQPCPDYDLIIVGASFAGLVAARTAAHRGLSVAVIDAKREPGARVRSTGILVKEAIGECDVPAALTRKIPGVRMYAPNGKHMDLTAPGYFFLATDTAGLMRWLAREAARAGAHLMFGARFTDATLLGDRVHLHGIDLSARYLLGADGARSKVAEIFGLGRNREFLIGMETEYEETPTVDPDFLHCFIDSKLAPGYLGWVVPGAGMTQVGLAVSDGPLGAVRKPDYQAFVKGINDRFAFWNCEVLRKRSGPIPCGGLVSPLSTHRVLLTGDAAGLVSPLTAGGIRLAFQYGRRAAAAISDYLQDGGPDPGIVMAKEYPTFVVKTWMRRLWSVAPPNALLNAALFTSPMRALAQRIYFERKGVKGADASSEQARAKIPSTAM
ncbi:NAD(P)/FAD-dependent oxidoreductase [Hyphococcus sp.]|jgi:geranylgeranyl reductase family protein|uniref:NAD(P)/FAD-dependent oxidoreductase n=1 Tax=Hyphococcus sp. TaxID=2038636 RepID=UPI003D0EF8E4